MRSRDDDFEHDCIVAHVALLDVDVQVRRGAEEALVVLAHGAQPVVALAPRSILVHRVAAERRQQTVEVVPVLVPHVLFDGGHPQAVAS